METSDSASQTNGADLPSVAAEVRRAVELDAAGSSNEAKRIYIAVLRNNPTHFGALSSLGVLAHRKGRLDEAKTLFAHAVAIAPENPIAHVNLGRTLILDDTLARTHFEEALRLDPNNEAARRGLAELLLQQGEHSGCLPSAFSNRAGGSASPLLDGEPLAPGSADKGIASDPASATGLAGVAQCVSLLARSLFKANRYEDTIAPLLRANNLIPENPALLGDLGDACLATGRGREAITWLKRSIALRPESGHAYCNLGRAWTSAGAHGAARSAFVRALALAPDLAEMHGSLAAFEMSMGRLTEAASAYERARALAPDTMYGRLCGAQALIAQERSSEAEQRLRQLIELDASCAEAHVILGRLLTEAGRFDEAAAHYERSMGLNPWQSEGYGRLFSTRRVTEADRPLLARVVARLEAPGLAGRPRMALHFAAGKALDDLKDYAGAIQHFDAANRIRREFAPALDRHRLEAQVDRLVARFTRDFFASHAAMGSVDETPILVLGMPRSGTTLCERVVSSHPRVGGGGERAFWGKYGPVWQGAEIERVAEAADRIRGEYLRELREVDPGALRVTDKMCFNFYWMGVVHLLFPNARMIHCQRHPVDTCLSIYSTNFQNIWEFASDRGDLAFYYQQYRRLMKHWRAVLPSDRFLEVDYEEMTGATEETAKRIIAFCDLEWDQICAHPDRNPDAVKTASIWQARQPIYRTSVERWRNYEPWLGELRQLLPTPRGSDVHVDTPQDDERCVERASDLL